MRRRGGIEYEYGLMFVLNRSSKLLFQVSISVMHVSLDLNYTSEHMQS
jgi:hypothetical protein